MPWERLARGYQAFYERSLPHEAYEDTWQRLMRSEEIFGFGARLNGRLTGIAHYFFHSRLWYPDVCYLQDLFVEESCRGRGVGRALIAAVTERARQRGCSRIYWHTREDNLRARVLYDSVASFDGFIRYDRQL